MAVTVTHVTIPYDIDEVDGNKTCLIKLSNDGARLNDVSLTLIILNAPWGGGTYTFYRNQNVPVGVNTLSLPINWIALKKFRYSGAHYYLFQNTAHEPSEFQIGETWDEEELILLDEGELPEFIYE